MQYIWPKTLNPNERTSVFHVRDENRPNMSSDWLICVVRDPVPFRLYCNNLRECPCPCPSPTRRCAFNPETYLCMPFRSFSLPDAFLACVSSFIVAQTIAQTRVLRCLARGIGWWLYAILMTRPRTLSLYISLVGVREGPL